MYAPRFPFDLYLVVNYIKFLVHFGPIFLLALFQPPSLPLATRIVIQPAVWKDHNATASRQISHESRRS